MILSQRPLLLLAALAMLASCSGGAAVPTAQTPVQDGNALALASTRPYISPEPQPSTSKVFGSTWGKIAAYQVFDQFPTTGTAMTDAQITADAPHYAIVWGSFNPGPWRSANRATAVSHYFVPPEDSNVMSGHNLAWFQQNHPDWIEYTCDPSTGQMTNQYAYTPGIGYPDVPLDMSNPDVINYDIYQVMVPYMQANNYNAIALDQINFNNILQGGNPKLGQTIIAGYYACGHYDLSGNPVIRYTSKSDPTYAKDMLNWITSLHNAFTTDPTLTPYHYRLLVNHQLQSQSDPNEQALLKVVDLEMLESGFADYGNYYKQTIPNFFLNTLSWMKWVQSNGAAIGIIDKFDQETAVTSSHLEYSIATYLLGNNGAAFLYTAPNNGPGYGYGADQWHQEYLTAIGKPCAESYGGPSYNSATPNLYFRKFTNGMVVVSFGATTTQNATFPVHRVYTDLESRTITNPLPVAPNDAYVLLAKTAGSGCQ